jgi:hypothetical protein
MLYGSRRYDDYRKALLTRLGQHNKSRIRQPHSCSLGWQWKYSFKLTYRCHLTTKNLFPVYTEPPHHHFASRA